jgi:hypothetical protein
MDDRMKKVLLGLGAFGALAIGAAQLAGAQSSSSTPPPATSAAPSASTSAPAAEAPGTETADGAEKDGAEEQADTLTGATGDKVSAAALAAVGSGKVTDMSAENQDAADQGGAPETPDKGEPADPAYEARSAYSAEVTKADGSVVDVHLDQQFNVLGTQAAEQEGPGA